MTPYPTIDSLPAAIPVFPLPGVLLLPQAKLPLNIFEPRYLAMTDDAIRSDRIIGMIQPADASASLKENPELRPVGCAGRISQFAETGDGRYLITLTGVARFRIIDELEALTPYRKCKVDFQAYASDIEAAADKDIDRTVIIDALKEFSKARNLRIDWRDIEMASNALLIDAMSMMGPFGPEEKQALLEAPDVKARGETLVAIIEIDLAKSCGATRKLQ
ncbi:MAG: LON peptidase substrate-binding domain-containing protein [Hyphomicrobiales bacterium]|nr:LON peptidase substrate-binding domain-containing protein [Hyphomicrobiales bacterium]